MYKVKNANQGVPNLTIINITWELVKSGYAGYTANCGWAGLTILGDMLLPHYEAFGKQKTSPGPPAPRRSVSGNLLVWVLVGHVKLKREQ